jgi:hypothetical protein
MSDSLAIRDQRQPGWYFVDNEIIDQHGRQLGAYGVAVYNVLSRYAKNRTQQVDLSARDIGAAIGISQDRVRKSLADLMGVGLIDLVIPERRAPGLITTITLLNVKQELNATRSVDRKTERHTFCSPQELNATRSRNKEVKTNTETKTETLPLSLTAGFSLFENQKLSSSNTRARAKEQYTAEDHLEKILRKISKAQPEIDAIAERQPHLPSEDLDELLCQRVGITLERLDAVRALQLKRPDKHYGRCSVKIIAIRPSSRQRYQLPMRPRRLNEPPL